MEQHIIANAEMLRSVAANQLNAIVNYDEDGVRWLDDYIKTQCLNAGEETKEALPNTLGAFLGECIRRTYGGEWVQDTQTESWGVRLNEKLTLFPFNKVRKQLAGGDGESVLGLFTSVGPLLSHLEALSANSKGRSSKPRRAWWQLW